MSKEKNKVYIFDEKGMNNLKKELQKLKEELASIQSYIKESAFDRKDLCGIQIDAQSVGRLQFQIYTIEEKLENAVLLEESDLGKAVYKKEIGTTVSYGKNNAFKAEIIRKVNEMDKEAINKPSQLLKK